MHVHGLKVIPALALATGGVVVGLAVPAAAHATRHLISGSELTPNSVTGKQVKESTLGMVPRATEARKLPPLVWHKLALKDDWVANSEAPAYAIDAQGLLIFHGEMKGGAGDTMPFVLPKSVRPDHDMEVTVTVGSGTGELVIVPDGKVFAEDDPDHPGGATALTDLDGVVIPPQ